VFSSAATSAGELVVVFGSFTLAIIALQGFQATSPAMAWSLVCGALGSGILAMRGTRASAPPVHATPVDAR
jgi:hypothetical protein